MAKMQELFDLAKPGTGIELQVRLLGAYLNIEIQDSENMTRDGIYKCYLERDQEKAIDQAVSALKKYLS